MLAFRKFLAPTVGQFMACLRLQLEILLRKRLLSLKMTIFVAAVLLACQQQKQQNNTSYFFAAFGEFFALLKYCNQK